MVGIIGFVIEIVAIDSRLFVSWIKGQISKREAWNVATNSSLCPSICGFEIIVKDGIVGATIHIGGLDLGADKKAIQTV